MAVLDEQVQMEKNGKHRRRHRPECGYRNTPPVPHVDGPGQERVVDDNIRGWLKPVQEPLERLLHLGHGGSGKGRLVRAPDQLRRQHVWDGAELDAGRFVHGADEAEPLLRHYEGDDYAGTV